MELASLQIAVDSRPARTAADDLDRLTGAGARTEKAMTGVGAGGKTAAAGSAAAATGSRAATSAMDAQAASAQRLTAAIRSYAVIAVSGMSAMGLIDAADQWGQMASRIRMATKSVEEYDRVQARMVVSATTTYRSITETREAFIQMSPVLRQMGMSLDESMDAIDAFSGLMVTNAASTERGTAAMRALSISMQKGKMDADQWITIYSSLDSIVDTIAAHSGMAAEEIRRLGAEGKLSVSLIAQALAGQLAPIMAQVEKMPTTVRDAMQSVSTAFTQYIGKANEVNGTTAAMADGILFLGKNLTTILNAALIAGGAAFARYAVVAAASGAQSAINAALARAQAAEELKLAHAHVAVTTAAVAQARASALLAGGMAQQTVAATALTAAQQRLAVAQAATAVAGRGMLAILGGPVGIAITAGLAATAFMTMGGSADAASVNIDTLASSLGELNRKQLELRQFELEDVVKSLESQAAGSGAILRTLQADIDALTARYGAYSEGMDGARRSLLEQEEAHNQNLASLDKAQSLLNQVTGRMQDLDGAARGAAGGVNTLNAAMSFTEAGEKYLGQIQNRIKALQDGGDPVKAATRWTLDHADASESDKIAIMSAALAEKALQDARDRAAQSMKSSRSAMSAATKAAKEAEKAVADFAKAQESELDAIYNTISGIQQQAQALEDEAATYGMGKAAIEEMIIARLAEQSNLLAMYGDKANPAMEAIEAEIEARKRLMAATANKEALDANKKASEQAAQEWQKTNDQIGQSLTDALLRGFESGKSFADNFKSTMINMFKTLILQPIIQPIMSQVAGGVQSLFGMGGQQGQQQGGGTDLFGMAKNAQSAYSAINGGMSTTIGDGAQWIGKQVGSEALSSWGLGLSGSAGAAGTVAGITALGSGLGASLGTAIGTSAAAMTTTTFAASMAGGALIPGMGVGIAGAGVGAGIGAAGAAAGAGAAAAGGAGAAASGLGAAMGVIGTAMPYIGAAIAIASALGVFGDGPPKTRHSQRTTAELTGGTFGITERDDRVGAGGAEAVQQMADASVKAANEIFSKVGVNAAIDSFYAIMESSVLGDRNGVASGGTLRSGDGTTSNIGIGKASDMTVAGFGGWSEEEMLPRLATDIQLSILQAFQQKAGELPKVMADMLNGVDIRGLGTEETAALIARFYGVVTEVESFRMALDTLPFDSLKKLSFDAAAGLIAAAGGLENLNTGLASYYQNFYSQEEQLALSAKNIETALSGVGLAMPDVTSSATAAKDAFRSLFESLDPATESGAAAIATMLGLNESFAQLAAGMEQLNAASVAAAQAEAQRVEAIKQAAEAQRQAALDALIAVRDAAVQSGHGAMDALTRSVEASKSALQKAFDAIAESLNTSINASRTSISALESMAGRLRSTLDSMRGQTDDRASRTWAQSQISQARAAGVAPSGADFEQALSIIAQPSEGLFATFEDYQIDFLKTANDISALSGITDKQLTIEQRTLNTLEDQLKAARSQFEQEMAAYDTMIELAQSQLDVALGDSDVLLSIPQALLAIAAAIGKVSLADKAVVGGGGTSLTGAYDAVDWATKNHFGAIGVGSTIDWAGGSLTRVDENTSSYVGPNGEVVQIGAGQSIADIAAQSQAIRDEWEKTFGYKLPGFAAGTNYVPRDMTANIHEGERIIPKADNTELMRRLSNPGNNSAALVAEIRALRSEVEGLRSEARATAQHTNKTAKLIERAMPDGDAIQTREAVTA